MNTRTGSLNMDLTWKVALPHGRHVELIQVLHEIDSTRRIARCGFAN